MNRDRPVPFYGVFALSSMLLLGSVLLLGSRSTSPVARNDTADTTVQAPAASAQSPPPSADFDTLRTLSQHVFAHTNQTRRERSLPALQPDSTLSAIGCAHNADMFRRNFFEHVNPDGEHPQDRVAHRHRRLIGGVGENLYEQTRIQKSADALGEQIVEQWMDSLPHRKNILRSQYTHLGVCALHRNDTLRVTQVFAKVAAYLSAPLPHRLKRNTTLPVSFSATFPPDANPVQYDFWDAEHDRIVAGPYVLTDSLRIPDTTGTIWSRFYVLETGRYSIQRGPKIIITSP